ncbi:helix-turn-helix domain-containing protein [Bdellovibrionota bacterium FG-1]
MKSLGKAFRLEESQNCPDALLSVSCINCGKTAIGCFMVAFKQISPEFMDIASILGNDFGRLNQVASAVPAMGRSGLYSVRQIPPVATQPNVRIDSLFQNPVMIPPETHNQDALITPKQAAALLGVKLSNIYYWSSRGEIPFVRVGRQLRFESAQLILHFKSIQKSGNKPTKPKSGKVDDFEARLSSLKSKFSRPADKTRKE